MASFTSFFKKNVIFQNIITLEKCEFLRAARMFYLYWWCIVTRCPDSVSCVESLCLATFKSKPTGSILLDSNGAGFGVFWVRVELTLRVPGCMKATWHRYECTEGTREQVSFDLITNSRHSSLLSDTVCLGLLVEKTSYELEVTRKSIIFHDRS